MRRPGRAANRVKRLTHINADGAAHMVDVGAKPETARSAVASGRVVMAPATAAAIVGGTVGKGEVLGVARIAGIEAAKRTADLIPLCHPLRLTGVDVRFVVGQDEIENPGAAGGRPSTGISKGHSTPDQAVRSSIEITVAVSAVDRSGVEMEALAAVAAAALTIYDMCKAIDRAMVISQIRLEEKRGGKSGTWQRAGMRPAKANGGARRRKP